MISVMGGKNLTDEQLKKIELVRPDWVSDRWQGIRHYDLVKTMEERMDAAGWKFEDRKVAVDNTGFDMVGAWNLTIPGWQEMEDQKLAIGFAHSNRCKRSLRLMVGSVVRVCTNGMATGEIILAKKHTVGLELGEQIDEGLQKYLVAAKEVETRTNLLKSCELTDEQVDHILMQAGRDGLVGFATLGQVSKEYLQPTFADNGTKTAWGLYNAFTYVIKKTCVNRQLELLYDFQKMMPVSNTVVAA